MNNFAWTITIIVVVIMALAAGVAIGEARAQDRTRVNREAAIAQCMKLTEPPPLSKDRLPAEMGCYSAALSWRLELHPFALFADGTAPTLSTR